MRSSRGMRQTSRKYWIVCDGQPQAACTTPNLRYGGAPALTRYTKHRRSTLGSLPNSHTWWNSVTTCVPPQYWMNSCCGKQRSWGFPTPKLLHCAQSSRGKMACVPCGGVWVLGRYIRQSIPAPVNSKPTRRITIRPTNMIRMQSRRFPNSGIRTRSSS